MSRVVILGAGKTLCEYDPRPGDRRHVLNGTCLMYPRGDVLYMSHYENIIQTRHLWHGFKKVMVPNPIPVGDRCVMMNLFDILMEPLFFKKFGDIVEYFKKTEDYKESLKDGYLFSGGTIANSVLTKLFKEGIKDVTVYGVDGGRGHSRLLDKIYKQWDDYLNVDFTKARGQFDSLAERYGIKIHRPNQVVKEKEYECV